MVKHTTQAIFKGEIEEFNYKKLHSLKELSEITIIHYMEKPVPFEIQVVQKVTAVDELTSRSSFMMSNSNSKGSFAMQL